MSDNDLIRRGDATKIANHLGFLDNPDSVAYAVSEAINAIPAVQPTVKPDDVAALVEALERISVQPDYRLPRPAEIARAARARVKGVM